VGSEMDKGSRQSGRELEFSGRNPAPLCQTKPPGAIHIAIQVHKKYPSLSFFPIRLNLLAQRPEFLFTAPSPAS
jgi:hypothetical protein